MTVAEYWNRREVQLRSELRELRRNAQDHDTDPQWKALNAELGRELPALFRKVVHEAKWRTILTFQCGLHSYDGAMRLTQNLLERGQLRLMMHVGPSGNRECPYQMWAVPSQAGKVYDAIAYSNLDQSRLRYPMLAVTVSEASGNGALFTIYPAHDEIAARWTIHLDYAYTRGTVAWKTGDFYPSLVSEASVKLRPLIERFRLLVQKEKEVLVLRARLQRVEEQLGELNRVRDIWAQLQLPDEQLLEIIKNAEMFADDNPAKPQGLLLKGVPGTGKTMLAQTLAKVLNCNFIAAKLADLKQPRIGESVQQVRKLWQSAREKGPSIIFIDECDSVFGKRGAAETHVIAADMVQAFLGEWDGNDKNVWVIGATNRRDMLDEAIVSRFGWEMEIALPAERLRQAILRQELKAAGFQGEMPPEIGRLTQGMSGRDLHKLARRVRSAAHPSMPVRQDFLVAVKAFRGAGNTQVDEQASWNTLILNEETIEELKAVCSVLQDVEGWRQQGVTVSSGMLLVGPPGTGKTQIARTLANEAGLAFVGATTAEIKANFLGQSANRVRNLFERARASAPAIVFLDELDIIAPARAGGSDDALVREIVGQLLQEIDGIRRQPSHVFLLAATNFVEMIDAGILDRFMQKIVIPLPDLDCRRRFLEMELKGKKISCALDLVCAHVARQSAGLSGRALKNWIGRAEQKAVRRAEANGGPKSFSLTLEDFKEARPTPVAA